MLNRKQTNWGVNTDRDLKTLDLNGQQYIKLTRQEGAQRSLKFFLSKIGVKKIGLCYCN